MKITWTYEADLYGQLARVQISVASAIVRKYQKNIHCCSSIFAKLDEHFDEKLDSLVISSLQIRIRSLCKGKMVKLFLCLINYAHCHKDVWGNGGIEPG
jgi:hypothetical protein